MRYAIDVAPLGELADPAAIVRLAREAEAAGWDGLSIWDSLGVSMGTVTPDPFLALGAVAAATDRLRLIASVIALPRRRPQLVAQAASTLDRISGGRLTLGVGSGGDPADFESFGEAFRDGQRTARFDEALAIVEALLRGETIRYEGSFYRATGAVGPHSVQEPRPPIWLGGMRPGALRRAARLDGWIAISVSEDGQSVALGPDAFADRVAAILSERAALGRGDEPFEIAVFGQTGLGGTDPAAYAAAGATWWLESLSGMRGSVDDLLSIVEAGPAGLGTSAAASR